MTETQQQKELRWKKEWWSWKDPWGCDDKNPWRKEFEDKWRRGEKTDFDEAVGDYSEVHNKLDNLD